MFLDIPVLIQARTGSKRFPQKVLKSLSDGHSIVWHVYNQCCKASNNVFVIGIKQDHLLFDHCKEMGIKMLAIPDVQENDLIRRYAVACSQLGATGFLRVTADCPYTFPQEIVWVGLNALKHRYDFVTNGHPFCRTTPDGVDCEYYSQSLINWMANNVQDEQYREHLPLYLYEKAGEDKRLDIFSTLAVSWPVNMGAFKFSIDTPEDLARVEKGEIL